MEFFEDLAQGRAREPFSVLGIHPSEEDGWVVRVFLPWATSVQLRAGRTRVDMSRVGDDGGWEGRLPRSPGLDAPPAYHLGVVDADGREWTLQDPYRFPPTLDEARVQAFLEGRDRRAHEVLGAHPWSEGAVEGTRFAVWAPHAHTVLLSGTMNGWDGRCHPMRPRGATGVWELFVPGIEDGALYKYQIVTPGGRRLEKVDPFGRFSEVRPYSASVVVHGSGHPWEDEAWLASRAERQAGDAPITVYEVHLGSWRRNDDGTWLGYRQLADTLIPYVASLGFTHLELLPVTEHPLDQSWGYQPVGFFAPTSRYGNPDDFRYFVDQAHRHGLGVILDWVPGHFATDAYGLQLFDGTPLFEPADRRQAYHPDWGTLTFAYGRPAVRSFLISSALYWIEEFHVDGLRVDAVASMLYLDYSREPGQWTPNREGGNTDLDAVDFLRALNDAVHQEAPGVLTVAEESTAWPGVSRGTDLGGLGFDQKWNMGWMNDTLSFMSQDPVYRKHHFDKLTFSLIYAFSERFILPFSHDEVVHGKGTLLSRMPGREPQKFANLRLLLAYQWLHPGKKLLFMGQELGPWAEWNVEGSVEWGLEAYEHHAGVRTLLRDLNRFYAQEPSLHALDFRPEGFEWLDHQDPATTTLAFVRWAPDHTEPILVAANFTPVTRDRYDLPVPAAGRWRVILNTDAPEYGGSGAVVEPVVDSRPEPLRDREHRVTFRLPGLSLVVLARDPG
ncbi:MAG TPA: 1,4-alpha-glucan branching protein GlgB [Longimicrobiales bacterium]|nr:1,4-alpha-glucan branching protein GlgB [Longimicrobiales bacterium]